MSPHVEDCNAMKPAPQQLVRPYALTSGRTRPHADIAPESLVSTTNRGSWGVIGGDPEWQHIAELCTQVHSLIEIAAQLELPLGVVWVIVSDMVDAGLVTVHSPGNIDSEIDTYLLERVLSGLRKL
ncbi:MAG: DUF742 domain-containing protein [Mycobacteriales bacterium]